MNITDHSPRCVWQLFSEICSIPHASGNEEALARHLASKAEQHGLTVRMDELFNLRIDRPAAPGRENAPHILLQAHLDMVPQVAPGKVFDFSKDPLQLVINGDWLRADGTTLGADDGIGVALAMAMLLDETLNCGKLSAVFTVNEEVGLTGASMLSKEFTAGDLLINLDHGDSQTFCIGCAGGERLHFSMPLAAVPAPAGTPVKITLTGLPGGHSGVRIHEKRGNALQMLCRAVREIPGFAIASFCGGTVDNAIPDTAVITGVISDPEIQSKLNGMAAVFKSEIAGEYTLDIACEVLPQMPEKVWRSDFQDQLLERITSAPTGVQEYAAEYGIPRTSCNIAIAKTLEDAFELTISCRSLDDALRDALSESLRQHFARISGTSCAVSGRYPGWTPRKESRLLDKAQALRKQLYGKENTIEIIHAGLEVGILLNKNTALDAICMSPTSTECHTTSERLSISDTAAFYDFFRTFLESL